MRYVVDISLVTYTGNMQKNKSGFTVVELMTVVIIIVILASASALVYSKVRSRTITAALKAEVSKVGELVEAYYSKYETYPASLNNLDGGKGYTSQSGINFTYSINPTDGYCLVGRNVFEQQSYYITINDKEPQKGDCEPTTNGVIGTWLYNGNSNDSSGNNLTGTVSGATLTTDRYGASNKAYYFNGSSYISSNMYASGKYARSRSFSLTLWFRTSVSADRKIASTDGTGTNILQTLPGGMLRTCISGIGCASGTGNYTDGNWHFAAVIGDGSYVRVYMDGSSTPNITLNNTANVYLGNVLFIGLNPFQGEIDDVRIFAIPMSVSDATEIYNLAT